MKYTVVWKSTAEDDLAKLWLTARNRNGVRVASDRIEALLRSNPLGIGQKFLSGRRLLFVNEIGVTYRVNDDDRIVVILNVWRTPKPTNGQPH